MADERELAALKAQVAAIEKAHAEDGASKAVHHYLVHAQVFSDCHMPIEEPPTEPEGSEAVHARLSRIEAQLERMIALLEQRGG